MKIKTHKGTAKRVKKTGSGKYRLEKGAKRHLLANKSKRQKNKGGNKVVTAKANVKKLAKLLPNS